MIDARLADYKAAIQEALSESGARFAVYIVDDFYLVNPKHHAEVIDYLHRLLRDTDLYLKVGTIRHRTRLSKTRVSATASSPTRTSTRSTWTAPLRTSSRPACTSRRCSGSSVRKSASTTRRRS